MFVSCQGEVSSLFNSLIIQNSMSYVLGIDGGGSKTVCILMNDKREILGTW